MSLLTILTAPHPLLKKKAEPVADIAQVGPVLEAMLETMYAAKGIGLAAPQVGISQRMLVMDVSETKDQPLFVINPEITWVSDEDNTYDEGCLSLPSHYAEVVRPAAVKVAYHDREGVAQEMHATGLLATCVQHEIDHLDGILFVDHIEARKRTMILRKLLSARRK